MSFGYIEKTVGPRPIFSFFVGFVPERILHCLERFIKPWPNEILIESASGYAIRKQSLFGTLDRTLCPSRDDLKSS